MERSESHGPPTPAHADEQPIRAETYPKRGPCDRDRHVVRPTVSGYLERAFRRGGKGTTLATTDEKPTVDEDAPPEDGGERPWVERAYLAVVSFSPSEFYQHLRKELPRTLRGLVRHDLRYSYCVAAGLVIVGAIVSRFIPHGWSVWPVVFVGGLLAMIDEAVDRNGTGIPPLRVIALTIGFLGAWLGMAMFLRVVHPIVWIMGIGVAAYYGIRGDMKRRAHIGLMHMRVARGECAHCGEPVDEGVIDCPHCGELTNPDGVRTRWSTLGGPSAGGVARTRGILIGESGSNTARRKEQALLDRRVRPGGGRPKR